MVIVAGVCLWVSIAVECVCVCVCVCGLVSSKCQAWRGGFVFMHLNLYFRYMGSFFPLLPNFSPRRKNQHLRMLYMCFLCKNLLVPGISQSCVLCVLWALSLSLSLSLSLYVACLSLLFVRHSIFAPKMNIYAEKEERNFVPLLLSPFFVFRVAPARKTIYI